MRISLYTTLCAASLLASSSAIALAAGSVQMPKNFTPPPAGFSPVTASADLLHKYGYPPKPVDPLLAPDWQAAVAVPRALAQPHFGFHGITDIHSSMMAPLGDNLHSAKVQAATYGSYNWAGSVLWPGYFNPALFGFGSVTYNTNTIPQVSLSKSVPCMGPGEYVSRWNGTGGFDPSSYFLSQEGDITGVDCSGNNLGADLWVEQVPLESAIFLGTNAQPGDSVYRQLYHDPNGPDGNGDDEWYFIDYTQNFSVSVYQSDPNPDGSSAEFIEEAPTINGQTSVLPDGTNGSLSTPTAYDPHGNAHECNDPSLGNQVWLYGLYGSYDNKVIINTTCAFGGAEYLYLARGY